MGVYRDINIIHDTMKNVNRRKGGDNLVSTMYPRDELCHYGVKGMKWGVRRTAAQLGHVVKRAAKSAKSAALKYAERHKPVSSMSDEELRKRLERLRTEMQYKQAMNTLHPKKKSAALKLVSEFGNNTVSSISRKITDRITKAMFPEPEKQKKISIIDTSKLDTYDDDAISAANRRQAQINMLLDNLDKYADKHVI